MMGEFLSEESKKNAPAIDPLTTENFEYRTVTEYNEHHDRVETYDIVTGKLVRVCSRRPIDEMGRIDWAEVEAPDGRKVLVERGLQLDTLNQSHGQPFDIVVALEIIHRLEEGESLHKICKDPKMPTRAIVNKWRSLSKSFNEEVERAIRFRAEYFRDMVEVTAEEVAHDKDDLADQKKRIEAYKWLASKDDHKKFGSTPAPEEQKSNPTIIINTFDRRMPDESEAPKPITLEMEDE